MVTSNSNTMTVASQLDVVTCSFHKQTLLRFFKLNYLVVNSWIMSTPSTHRTTRRPHLKNNSTWLCAMLINVHCPGFYNIIWQTLFCKWLVDDCWAIVWLTSQRQIETLMCKMQMWNMKRAKEIHLCTLRSVASFQFLLGSFLYTAHACTRCRNLC